MVDHSRVTQYARRRVLVVDDNQDAADSLAVLLRLMEQDVKVAYRGVTALNILSDFRPELVFLDLGMPEMDGFEVARRVREQPEFRQILIVALTGWGQHEDRQQTAAAGFNYHFVKPLKADLLRDLLKKCIPDVCNPLS